MDKDKCYYCINSDVKYATIYCIQRTKERHKICDYIYSNILPNWQYIFTSNSKHQQYTTAKGTGYAY